MPTILPRYQVTETDDVAHALDLAAKRWPGEKRALLLRRLILQGADVLNDNMQAIANSRRNALHSSDGKYDEAFGSNYLEHIREDWPE